MSGVDVMEEMYPGRVRRRRSRNSVKPETAEKPAEPVEPVKAASSGKPSKPAKPAKTIKPAKPRTADADVGSDSSNIEQMELQLDMPPVEKKRRRPRPEKPDGTIRYTMAIVGAMHMDGVRLDPGERLVVVRLTPVAEV